MPITIGQVIDDKYRIVRLLGEGGMGAVYEGENVRIRRRVAIKVLSASLEASPELVARFEREAQAAGQIGNDHILEVLDLGVLPDGNRFMVMEYLDGENLYERIKRHGRLTPEQLVPIARQFLSALEAAHGAGIIHRDLKPDNIFILREKAGRRDFVKLIDFGVSKFANLGPDAFRVTRAGTVVGTPLYMAPEQARGTSEADVRSDIYAVGVILYEALTGRAPFEGVASFNDLMFKIALSDPPAPRELVADLDPEFEAIIKKAMTRDPAGRYASVQALLDALEDWATSHQVPLSLAPVRPRRTSLPDVSELPQSDPKLPASSGRELAAQKTERMMHETLPAIESTPSLSSSTPGVVDTKKRKALYAVFGAAGLAGVALIVLAMTSGSERPSAVGIAPTAAASTTAATASTAATEADPIPSAADAGTSGVAIVASSPSPPPSVAIKTSPAKPPATNAQGRPAASTAKKPPAKPGSAAPDFGY